MKALEDSIKFNGHLKIQAKIKDTNICTVPNSTGFYIAQCSQQKKFGSHKKIVNLVVLGNQ